MLGRTVQIASGSASPYTDPSAAMLLGLGGSDIDSLGVATFAGDLATGVASTTLLGGAIGSDLQIEQIQREVPVVGLLGALGVLLRDQVRTRLDQSTRDQVVSGVGAVTGGLGKMGAIADFFASFGEIADAQAARKISPAVPKVRTGSFSLGSLMNSDLRQVLQGVTPADIAKIPLSKQLALPETLQRGIFRIHMGAAPFKNAVGHHIIPLEASKDYRSLFEKAAPPPLRVAGVGGS